MGGGAERRGRTREHENLAREHAVVRQCRFGSRPLSCGRAEIAHKAWQSSRQGMAGCLLVRENRSTPPGNARIMNSVYPQMQTVSARRVSSQGGREDAESFSSARPPSRTSIHTPQFAAPKRFFLRTDYTSFAAPRAHIRTQACWCRLRRRERTMTSRPIPSCLLCVETQTRAGVRVSKRKVR